MEYCPVCLIPFFFSFSPYSHALYSPAYLSEHVGHVQCSGGHCAVGVINGMMQHPWLLRLSPPQNHTHIHTTSTPPHLTLFLFCLFSSMNYVPTSAMQQCFLHYNHSSSCCSSALQAWMESVCVCCTLPKHLEDFIEYLPPRGLLHRSNP